MDSRDQKKIGDRIRNSAAFRGTITGVNDGAKMQEFQVKGLAGEAVQRVERFQNYGFTSHPPASAEGVFVPLGGDRSCLACVAIDDRSSRLGSLGEGDVAVYRGGGDYIKFTDGNKAELKTEELTVTAPKVIFTGDVEIRGSLDIQGSITVEGSITAEGSVTATGPVRGSQVTASGANVSLGSHRHTGDSGGDTSSPQAGT